MTENLGTTHNDGELHWGFSRTWRLLCPPCLCLLSSGAAGQSDDISAEERLIQTDGAFAAHDGRHGVSSSSSPRYHAVLAASEDAPQSGVVADHGRFSTASPQASWGNGSISVLADSLHPCFWSWDEHLVTGLGLTRKAAPCAAPGPGSPAWEGELSVGCPPGLPWLRTRGAVWDNTARKVGGTRRKEAAVQAVGPGEGSSSGCGARPGQGDPGNSSSTVWGQQRPSAQAGGAR